MTESKNNIVTTSTTYLDIVTFQVIVIESTLALLPLGRYLLLLTILNRYLSRYNNKTSFENVTITRCGIFQVTIQFFVLCHDSMNSAKVIKEKIR